MNIQYYGDYCFKISTKPGGRATEDVIVWTNPLGKGSGLRGPQGQVDLIIQSHAPDEEKSAEAELTLDIPGEYAVKGMALVGLVSFRDENMGAERGQNTIFVLESEELRLVFLGALGHDLDPDTLSALSDVDILFIPAGGQDTLPAKKAAELARKIEPRIVIPMHYRMPGLTVSGLAHDEKDFLESLGGKNVEKLTRFNVKKRDLDEKNLAVVLLEKGS